MLFFNMDILNSFLEIISKLDRNIILLLTALIIFLYTYYTFRLWKESKAQTTLLQTPYLILRFDKSKREFYLKNIGKSIATKIVIEGSKTLMTDIEKEFEIKFNTIELLEPEKERPVEYKIYENGVEISDAKSRRFAVYFFPIIPSSESYKNKKIIFRMTYKNIFGRTFYFDVLVAENEYRLKRFGKYGWGQKLRREIFLKLQGLKVRASVWYKRRSNKFKRKESI